MKLSPKDIPADFPVRPLSDNEALGAREPVTDGACGLTWDDYISTSYTPAPSARCPFEAFHKDEDDAEKRVTVMFTADEALMVVLGLESLAENARAQAEDPECGADMEATLVKAAEMYEDLASHVNNECISAGVRPTR